MQTIEELRELHLADRAEAVASAGEDCEDEMYDLREKIDVLEEEIRRLRAVTA